MTPQTQKMIDELKRLMASVEAESPWEPGHYKRRRALREAAGNALPALLEEVEKGPKWIPVTQELPLCPEVVLTWDGESVLWRIYSKRGFIGSMGGMVTPGITHWMLLPPAPASDNAREG